MYPLKYWCDSVVTNRTTVCDLQTADYVTLYLGCVNSRYHRVWPWRVFLSLCVSIFALQGVYCFGFRVLYLFCDFPLFFRDLLVVIAHCSLVRVYSCTFTGSPYTMYPRVWATGLIWVNINYYNSASFILYLKLACNYTQSFRSYVEILRIHQYQHLVHLQHLLAEY